MTDAHGLRSALIVGAGLMGASVALALRSRGVDTYITDRDPAAARLAADLGAGTDAPPAHPVDVAVIAVPPSGIVPVLLDLQGKRIAAAYTDLASTKSHIQVAATAAGVDLGAYVGGHPMAGRERSGPGAARADLFQGRPWVLTPSAATLAATVAAAETVVGACGATPVVMTAAEHDRAVALVSHAPQVVASLVAARLVDAPAGAVALAGQGMRDVTRIAASDPGLWREILATNATAVADVIDALREDLVRVAAELRATAGPTDPLSATVGLMSAGNAGEARLPGKHGAPHTDYAVVPVILPDHPGQLARLFTDAGVAGINIEDVRIEHSPGQPVGLVELAVAPAVADRLIEALRARGWSVTG